MRNWGFVSDSHTARSYYYDSAKGAVAALCGKLQWKFAACYWDGFMFWTFCRELVFWGVWDAVWWQNVKRCIKCLFCTCAGHHSCTAQSVIMCCNLALACGHNTFSALHLLLWISHKLFLIMRWSGQALHPHRLWNNGSKEIYDLKLVWQFSVWRWI